MFAEHVRRNTSKTSPQENRRNTSKTAPQENEQFEKSYVKYWQSISRKAPLERGFEAVQNANEMRKKKNVGMSPQQYRASSIWQFGKAYIYQFCKDGVGEAHDKPLQWHAGEVIRNEIKMSRQNFCWVFTEWYVKYCQSISRLSPIVFATAQGRCINNFSRLMTEF